MRTPLLIAALALAGTGAALAAGTPAGGASSTARPPEQVYSSTCGYCHGTNVGPIIRGRAIPAAMVQEIVRAGRNAMPAFRPTEISPAELKALAAWVEKSAADPKEKGQ